MYRHTQCHESRHTKCEHWWLHFNTFVPLPPAVWDFSGIAITRNRSLNKTPKQGAWFALYVFVLTSLISFIASCALNSLDLVLFEVCICFANTVHHLSFSLKRKNLTSWYEWASQSLYEDEKKSHRKEVRDEVPRSTCQPVLPNGDGTFFSLWFRHILTRIVSVSFRWWAWNVSHTLWHLWRSVR